MVSEAITPPRAEDLCKLGGWARLDAILHDPAGRCAAELAPLIEGKDPLGAAWVRGQCRCGRCLPRTEEIVFQIVASPARGGGFHGHVLAPCASPLAETPAPLSTRDDVWAWAAGVALRPACSHRIPGARCYRAAAPEGSGA